MSAGPFAHAASLPLVACSHAPAPSTLRHTSSCSTPQRPSVEPVQPALALAYDLSCALLADATVRCWGAGRWEAPTAAPALADVRSLSAYGYRTCAARRDGSVWCSLRVDGRGARVEGAVVFQRIAGVEGARSVAVGASHACAVREAGGVDCWAFAPDGTLAAGGGRRAVITLRDRSSPAWAGCVRDALAAGPFPRHVVTSTIGLPLRW